MCKFHLENFVTEHLKDKRNMDKHISSAAVWDENNPSDSFVKLTQSESVCEKSVSSVSVPTNLDCEKSMEKKRKVLLNCRACSRAKSSYDNHGFECFPLLQMFSSLPLFPISQLHSTEMG